MKTRHRVTVVHTADVAQNVCVFKHVCMHVHVLVWVHMCTCIYSSGRMCMWGSENNLSVVSQTPSLFFEMGSLAVLELTN